MKKCLAAGFQRVAVISPKVEHLKNIADAVLAGFGAEQANKVGYFTTDEFISELRRIAQASQPKNQAESKRKVRGYNVSSQASSKTLEDHKAKEEAMIRLLAEKMRRKPLRNA